jgi:hypothetical protein
MKHMKSIKYMKNMKSIKYVRTRWFLQQNTIGVGIYNKTSYG